MIIPLSQCKTLKQGWQTYKKIFGHLMPEGEEYKHEGAYYAGAATYNAVLFNIINQQIVESAATEEGEVHLNITQQIMKLKDEVHEFAQKQVNEGNTNETLSNN